MENNYIKKLIVEKKELCEDISDLLDKFANKHNLVINRAEIESQKVGNIIINSFYFECRI